jgi:hypothetical protein
MQLHEAEAAFIFAAFVASGCRPGARERMLGFKGQDLNSET